MSSVKAVATALILTAGLSAPAIAQVAGSLSTSGEAFVQRAGNYYAANGASELASGDCVTSLKRATTVTLKNGCTFTVQPEQSVVINPNATDCSQAFNTPAASCSARALRADARTSTRTVQTTQGGLQGGPGVSGGTVAAGGGFAGTSLGVFPILAGIAITGGIIAVAADNDDDDDENMVPISR